MSVSGLHKFYFTESIGIFADEESDTEEVDMKGQESAGNEQDTQATVGSEPSGETAKA